MAALIFLPLCDLIADLFFSYLIVYVLFFFFLFMLYILLPTALSWFFVPYPHCTNRFWVYRHILDKIWTLILVCLMAVRLYTKMTSATSNKHQKTDQGCFVKCTFWDLFVVSITSATILPLILFFFFKWIFL